MTSRNQLVVRASLSGLVAVAVLSVAFAYRSAKGGDSPDSRVDSASGGSAATSTAPRAAATAPSTTADRGGIPVYDTAWKMAAYVADDAESNAYLDYLAAAGFDGFWINVLPLYSTTYANNPLATVVRRTGETAASNGPTGPVLRASFVDHFRHLLDLAHERGLDVGVVPAWGQVYVCLHDVLVPGNARAYGAQVARELNHPAVKFWIVGGDTNCSEDVQIWRNLTAGLRDAGATQQVVYHTDTQRKVPPFWIESWLDVLAVQTGHCQSAAQTEEQLIAVRKVVSKPVYAGETRYYSSASPGCGSSENGAKKPVTAAQTIADGVAAVKAGVQGLVYGDADRYAWCVVAATETPTEGCDDSGVLGTLGRGGESGVIETAGRA